MRGPAAAFYGSGAIGGVIQIFTRETRGAVRPEVYVVGGSRGTAQLQARISGGDANSRYTLAGTRDTTRGFDVTRQGSTSRQIDDDGNRQTSFTGLLTHRLTSDLQVGAQFLSTAGRENTTPALVHPQTVLLIFVPGSLRCLRVRSSAQAGILNCGLATARMTIATALILRRALKQIRWDGKTRLLFATSSGCCLGVITAVSK